MRAGRVLQTPSPTLTSPRTQTMAKVDEKNTLARKQRRKRLRESDRRKQLKLDIVKRIGTVCDRRGVDPFTHKALLDAVEKAFRRQSAAGHPPKLPKDMPPGDLLTLVDAERLVRAGKEKSVHTALCKIVPVAQDSGALKPGTDPETHVSRLWNFYKRNNKKVFGIG
jgi:hypothetical protein